MEAIATKTVMWRDRPVEAAWPDPIAAWEPELSVRTVRLTERAAGAVQRLGERTTGSVEAAARLLLRTEGLASSAIEGLRAPVADVAFAQASATSTTESTAAWVADNLAVVQHALATPRPLDVAALLGWHTRLMRSSPTIEARHVGAWRDRLGWIGGTSPLLAAHVAAPADAIAKMMYDLVLFVARDDIDPITQAAVAHAHFETVHPFADGNGRIGRVLIGWVLATRLGVNFPPPVSLQMARDVGGYVSGLTLYRQGMHDTWVSWFAGAIIRSAEESINVLAAAADLQDQWQAATAGLRSDSAARQVCVLLPEHPVLSTATVAGYLNVSREAARTALVALSERGILEEIVGPGNHGRPQRWWEARALLDLLGRAGR